MRLANSTLICLSVPPSETTAFPCSRLPQPLSCLGGVWSKGAPLCLVGLRMQPPLRFRGEEAVIAGLCKDDITVDPILSQETEISMNAIEISFCAVNLHHA